MKKILIAFGLLATVLANASTFNTTSYVMSVATATSVETTTADSIERSLTGFSVAAGAREDIAWTFNFSTATAPPYQTVKLTISGFVTPGGNARVRGAENVFSTSPTVEPAGSGLASVNVPNSTNGNIPFTAEALITLNPNVSEGYVAKDISVRNLGTAGQVVITNVKQEFVAVPEPATLAALGLGAVALLRRKRK